jgi:multidrug efflux pump subunit AcrA (membrane-fusion protein)
MVESVFGIGTVTARRTYRLKLGVTDTLERICALEGEPVQKGDCLIEFGEGRTFLAPFTGVITSLPFKIGETVFPQVPVLVLTDLKDPYVVVALEQSGALRVKQGQPAFLSFESIRGRQLEGTVSSLYPRDGEFFVNIEVRGIPPEILVGMTCDVAILAASREEVLQVPLAAVTDGTVTALRGGIPRRIPVKLGVMDGTWAEVVGPGIEPDDVLLLPRED